MTSGQSLVDPEFGTITIRRNPHARSIRIRVAPNGRLRASMPPRTPLFLLKKTIAGSRTELRALLNESIPHTPYTNGDSIGKSHTLVVTTSERREPKITRSGQQLLVDVPQALSIESADIQRQIRDESAKIYRREAKAYLPRRLAFLANKYQLSYQTVRFSHASSRWGSCSSNGTISLNIALMKLPFELIDYVLLHELAHTIEMNHSQAFWSRVEQMDPAYRSHRTVLKDHTPTI